MPTDNARNARAVAEHVDREGGAEKPLEAALLMIGHAALEIAAQLERLADRRSASSALWDSLADLEEPTEDPIPPKGDR